MALQQQIKTKAEWVTFFLEADIPQVESDTYHHIYQHHITELTMSRTDNQTLLDIRINTLVTAYQPCNIFKANQIPPLLLPN